MEYIPPGSRCLWRSGCSENDWIVGVVAESELDAGLFEDIPAGWKIGMVAPFKMNDVAVPAGWIDSDAGVPPELEDADVVLDGVPAGLKDADVILGDVPVAEDVLDGVVGG